ncbi:hypothetical protein SDRG_11570 [Saprolegnia diclina VS20]|uniref:Uncharacterized protein n=1 Tax=Saprolegnia diclina (strain VS20) TaxID=1156394 RepID=T0QB99_SAPDV|nr:hypothetical protein SDRG_11570 [Saprolegnia diclina VS20]EQC30810.1 hypothetical protein SDRG_11570 [Saprolegnia diclina VS20]|eukprot:XP_008615834.1 hypothetical protein SDRG_11570 [Saprolegnia diclina VS20]
MRVSTASILAVLASTASAKMANHQCVDIYRGARYCFEADGVVCGASEGACPKAGTKAGARCLDFLESYNGDSCVLPRDTVCEEMDNKWRCVLPGKPSEQSHGYVTAPGTQPTKTEMAQPRHGGLGSPKTHKPHTPAPTTEDVDNDEGSDSTEGSDSDSGSSNNESDDGSDDDATTKPLGDSANTNPNDTGGIDDTMASVLGNPVTQAPTNYTLGDAATAAPTTETVHSVSNQAESGATGVNEAPSQGMVAVYAVGGIACVAAAMFAVHKRRATLKAKADDECLVTPAVPHPDILPKEGSTTPTLMASTEKIKVTNV